MKQIALAMHNFHDTHRSFPAAFKVDEEKKPLLSWRVELLPFLEQGELYKQFKHDEPWDSEHNKKLIAKMPQVFAVPGSEAAKSIESPVRSRSAAASSRRLSRRVPPAPSSRCRSGGSKMRTPAKTIRLWRDVKKWLFLIETQFGIAA